MQSHSPNDKQDRTTLMSCTDTDPVSGQKSKCTEASSEQCEDLRDYAFAPFVCDDDDAGVSVDFERVAGTGEVIAFTPADLGVQDADTDNED
jgi:hypothetical protein